MYTRESHACTIELIHTNSIKEITITSALTRLYFIGDDSLKILAAITRPYMQSRPFFSHLSTAPALRKIRMANSHQFTNIVFRIETHPVSAYQTLW